MRLFIYVLLSSENKDLVCPIPYLLPIIAMKSLRVIFMILTLSSNEFSEVDGTWYNQPCCNKHQSLRGTWLPEEHLCFLLCVMSKTNFPVGKKINMACKVPSFLSATINTQHILP